MASYTLNKKAVANIRKLIAAGQYVLDSDWGEVQPRAPTTRTNTSPSTTGTSTPPGTWA